MQQGNDTKLTTTLKLLVEELNRSHSDATPCPEEPSPFASVVTENRKKVTFNKKSLEELSLFSSNLFNNRKKSPPKIELEEFTKVVRQAVADMYASGAFENFDENESKKRLCTLIEERIAKMPSEYTHYFPAWTLGMEKEAPFTLGPVTFLTISHWIDSANFELIEKWYLSKQPEKYFCMKDILRDALQKNEKPNNVIARTLCDAIAEPPSMVKVTIRGYEHNLSYKLARLVAKAALDVISLVIGKPECFHQQALREERLSPPETHRLVETNGMLWAPGVSLGKRIPLTSPAYVKQALTKLEHVLPAFENILERIVTTSEHSHRELAKRWATALNWFGEGNREYDDAIALTKLAISLEVLSGGGNAAGITCMLSNLTGFDKTRQVIRGIHPQTLEQLVNSIYSEGRSQIVHGTHYDRLKSFADKRRHTASLASFALIESAIRLQKYTGKGDDKTFQTIPK